MRQGRFKIAKQTGQTAHFALVELTVEPATADEIILNADTRGWSESVRHGVAEALAALRRRRTIEPVRVTVTTFRAMVIDTRKADAEAAALLATLSAFLEPSMMPAVDFSYDEAGCAASARVEINGAYYGLYVAEETTSKRVLKQFFPDQPDGDLWKGGVQPETNRKSPNWDRQMAFAQATDIGAVSAIADLDASVSGRARRSSTTPTASTVAPTTSISTTQPGGSCSCPTTPTPRSSGSGATTRRRPTTIQSTGGNAAPSRCRRRPRPGAR